MSGTHTRLKIAPRTKNRREASLEEEVRELENPCFATQWNAALYDDECLLIVPRSHRRPRTEEERKVNLEGDARGVMPQYPNAYRQANGYREKRVLVPAGSVLFYDHNILHRATYSTSPERGT
jgi:hypothetical protein